MRSIFFFSALVFAGICTAQNELQPDEDRALVKVFVGDMEGNVRYQDLIRFQGQSGAVYQGLSDRQGNFAVLLPEGDTYTIYITGLGEEEEYSELEIPAQPGKIRASVEIRYQPERTFTLRNVHFDSGKSTLRSESFASLNEIAQALRLRTELTVEIAGHTDDVGNDQANLSLSQARAEAVVKYLVSKGVSAKQLQAKGYGESQPIADNATPEGRQANRRTEARILNDL